MATATKKHSAFEAAPDWCKAYYMDDAEVDSTYDLPWGSLLEKADVIAFDTETNGRDLFGDPFARVNGFSVAVKIGEYYYSEYFPVNHIDGPNIPQELAFQLLEIVSRKLVIMHNAIFDLRAFQMLTGFLMKIENFIDTMKLAHLHDENYSSDGEGNKEGYSLENCCMRYLGHKGKKASLIFNSMLNLLGWNAMDFDSIREYAAGDTLATYHLWEAIMRKTKREIGLPNYWKTIEAPNLIVLSRMRELGVKVNVPLAVRLEARGMEIMRNIESEIGVKFSGPGSVKATQDLFWNTLGLPVITNKKTGKPTLDKEAMKRYDLILERTANPIAAKLLEFRGWQKSVTSFYRPYQELLDSDGRIRTDFKPHGTVTGRYSSSKPNLQQIPKESDKEWNGHAKDCFMPEDGYELWEFDYSQLEFRLSASYAREPKLLDVFNDDARDIFDEMALDLGLTRQQCKTLTYSIQYGAGEQRIMDVFGYSRTEARNAINSWYNNYPGIRRVSDQAKQMASQFGKVEIWSGRFRHFHKPKMEARKAFNSTIQGGAADMVKVTMNNVAREMPELRMVLQVHDALWFEIPKGEVASYLPQIKSVMEQPTEQIKRVRLKVDGHRVGSIAA